MVCQNSKGGVEAGRVACMSVTTCDTVRVFIQNNRAALSRLTEADIHELSYSLTKLLESEQFRLLSYVKPTISESGAGKA